MLGVSDLRSTRARSSRVAAAMTLNVLVLAGCSSSQPDSSDVETPTPPAETSSTSEKGNTTPPGTDLRLGKTAVVRYKANARHDSRISLTVTTVRKGKIKHLSRFNPGAAASRSTVYYVSARVKNTGSGDLSGQPITLYGKVSDKLVVPPVTFGSTFRRCDYEPLPKEFGKGDRAGVCMVMLAPRHGKISEVQWRPDRSEPIAWTVR